MLYRCTGVVPEIRISDIFFVKLVHTSLLLGTQQNDQFLNITGNI